MKKKHLLPLACLLLMVSPLASCNNKVPTPTTTSSSSWVMDSETRKFMDTFTFRQDPGPDGINANFFAENIRSTDDLVTITGIISQGVTEEITIPSEVRGVKVVAIGDNAFRNSSAARSTIKTINLSSNITSIGTRAFQTLSLLENINIPRENSLVRVNDNALTDTAYISKMKAAANSGNSLQFLGNVLVAAPTDIGTNVTVPAGTKSIYYEAFADCKDFGVLSLPDGLEQIGGKAFSGTTVREVTIPDSVTTIGSLAFANNTDLRTIRFPNNIEFEHASTPNYLSGSTNVETLRYDGHAEVGIIFGGVDHDTLTSLTNITITDNADHSLIEDSLKDLPSLEELYIAEEIKTIEDGALSGVTTLSTISFPSELEYLGESSIEDTQYYKNLPDADSVIYFGKNLFKIKENQTSFTFREGTTGISPGAINNRAPITSLVPTIKYIGAEALSGNSTITSIVLPELKMIGDKALANCLLLDEIDLSFEAELGDLPFENCTKVTSLSLNITSSMSRLFGTTLPAITELEIPEGITEIAASTFRDYDSLVSVTLPSTLQKIGQNAFYGCANLESITIPERVVEIGAWAFAYCPKLKNVVFEETKTTYIDLGIVRARYRLSIGYFAFAYNEALDDTFTVPNRTLRIAGAFLFGSSVKEIVLEIDPNNMNDFSYDRFDPLNENNSLRYDNSWNQTDSKDSYGNQERIPYRATEVPYVEPSTTN